MHACMHAASRNRIIAVLYRCTIYNLRAFIGLQAKRNDADLAGRPANDQFHGCILRDLRACQTDGFKTDRPTDSAQYRLYTMHHSNDHRPYIQIYHIVKSKWQRSFKRTCMRGRLYGFGL